MQQLPTVNRADSLPRQLRKLRGFRTVRELADRLGVTPAMVTSCETGRKKPGRDLALLYEQVVGVPVSYWALPVASESEVAQ